MGASPGPLYDAQHVPPSYKEACCLLLRIYHFIQANIRPTATAIHISGYVYVAGTKNILRGTVLVVLRPRMQHQLSKTGREAKKYPVHSQMCECPIHCLGSQDRISNERSTGYSNSSISRQYSGLRGQAITKQSLFRQRNIESQPINTQRKQGVSVRGRLPPPAALAHKEE